MRAYICGSSLTVAVSENDIAHFMGQWPGSGLQGLRGVTFTFENNGDLVDISYRNGSSKEWDGTALVALSHDAQVYGSERMLKSKSRKAKRANKSNGQS